MFAHDSQTPSLCRVDALARQGEILHPAGTYQRREPLCSRPSWASGNRSFRQSETGRRGREADVGDRGKLQPAAKRMAIDSSNDRHAHPGPLIKNLVASPDPAAPHVEWLETRPGVDVGTDAESFVAGRAQD